MSSESTELVVLSLFHNGYLTLLDAEIRDHLYRTRTCSREDLMDALCSLGYGAEAVSGELERKRSSSAFRFMPREEVYISTDMGTNLWEDILNRIHDQASMVAGRVQFGDSQVEMEIYCTDFQSSLRGRAESLGLRRVPVMKWTGKYTPAEALKCLDHLMEMVPFTFYRREGNFTSVPEVVRAIVGKKPPKSPWAWIVTHPVVQVRLTPCMKKVLKVLFSLSGGPVDWKGALISPYELQTHTGLPREEVIESAEYLMERGIIGQMGKDFAPTVQGYILVRYILRPRPSVTFAITRRTEKEYVLEVSTPTTLDPEIRDLLKEQGGGWFTEVHTPAIFPFCERSHIVDVMGMVIENSIAVPVSVAGHESDQYDEIRV